MKRFVSIIVVLVLLANTVGFYAYYFVQLQQIRYDMKQALKTLPREQLDVLTLTRIEFEQALEDENEIEFHGRMYDIASVVDHGNIIIVYCKHDKREDSLMAMLEYVINVPVNEDNQIPSAVWQYLMLVFVIPFMSVDLLIHFTNTNASPARHFSVSSRVQQILTPPPRANLVF